MAVKNICEASKQKICSINTKPNSEHKYKLRSCTNCERWESCKCGMNRPEGFVCDYGKYGCIHYTGKFIDEKSKSNEANSNQ